MDRRLLQVKKRVERLKRKRLKKNKVELYIALDFSREDGVEDIRFRIPIVNNRNRQRNSVGMWID